MATLPLKYFVIDPSGSTPAGVAGRLALIKYADEIYSTDKATADALVAWVNAEAAAASASEKKES